MKVEVGKMKLNLIGRVVQKEVTPPSKKGGVLVGSLAVKFFKD